MSVAIVILFAVNLMPNLLLHNKKRLLSFCMVLLAVYLYCYHMVWSYNPNAPVSGMTRVMMDFAMAVIGGYVGYLVCRWEEKSKVFK